MFTCKRRPLILTLAGMLASTTFLNSVLAASLVWTDKDTVQVWRSNPDGSEASILYSSSDGLRDPRGIAVNAATGALYIADSDTNTIYAGDLAGNTISPLIQGLSNPADVVLVDDVLYWANQGSDSISKANLDGTGVVNVLAGLDAPYYLSVDAVNEHIYWTDFNSGIIHRAGLDGSMSGDYITGLQRVRDVEVDAAAGKVYWADRNSPDIRRQSLDGADVEVLYDSTDGLGRPHGLWLDPDNELIYWTDTTTGDVVRGNLDGIGTPEIVFNGASLNGPWELQLVVPEPLSLEFLVIGGLCFCQRLYGRSGWRRITG